PRPTPHPAHPVNDTPDQTDTPPANQHDQALLEVKDSLAPWNHGRWRLSGDTTGAACTRTDDSPDLTLDATALGSAYLGGVSLTELAQAGRVSEYQPGALAAATTAFAATTAPWMPYAFCRSLLPRL
ncbi:sterol carrier protein domain-containing protein, partial [Streptomyces murinus]|uniref:sterol carrier protein domain-containing protein n=1 Tax=Streptomyces murinus TaxID=33900 RepID=UPI0038041C04